MHTMPIIPRIFCFICLFCLFSCDKGSTTATNNEPITDFSLIQDKILTPSCAISGCHLSDKDATFTQHGLVLAKGVSYKNLLNIIPKNVGAKDDGLLLVKVFDSNKSLLYHKLLYNLDAHGGKSYGSVMPLGAPLLPAGKIEFLRRWIESGAKETENLIDTKLLDDTTPSVATFTPLAPPTTETGYQMKLDLFEVAPNFERELFVRKPLGNTETVYINRFQIKMRPGSHHFILYDFRDKNNVPAFNSIRDLRNTNGSYNLQTFLQMGNHVFMFGGQYPSLDYTFPEGTAIELPVGASFDMNSHYFNKSSSEIVQGEVYINLLKIPKEKVKNIVKVLDLGINNPNELSLPPNKRTILTKDFYFDKNIRVVTLFSHTHKYGEKFEVLIKGGTRDGEVVYTSADWEHPNITNYSSPITLKKGEGLTSRITYNNTSSKTVTFGLTSEDEMGIIFGYYYEE